VPTQKVIERISCAVNEGRIQRSDVLFTLPQKERIFLSNFDEALNLEDRCFILKEIFNHEVDVEEIELHAAYLRNNVHVGDLYDRLSNLERTLHSTIQMVLVKHFGSGEAGWWRDGVPEKVRLDCVQSREKDKEFVDDPYCYTTLIHLSDILKDNWGIFTKCLPAEMSNDKPKLMQDFRQLNTIRNKVMHPVRGDLPTEQEFGFVTEMHKSLQISRWRLSGFKIVER